MAFNARGYLTIGRQYLADLVARYADRGKPLAAGAGSNDALQANALGVAIAPIEANAQALSAEILPDTCSPAGLARFASVYAIPRVPAVAAVITWRVLSPLASTLITFGSGVLTVAATGVNYATAVASAVTSASTVTVSGTAYYYADVVFTATTAGAAGSAADGTLATWSSAPAGAATIAQAVSTGIPGADEEDVEVWRSRIVARLQERPGTFNRADVKAYGEAATAKVTDVYVYPLLAPLTTLDVNTPGCVTAVCMGPATVRVGMDDRATDTRIPSTLNVDLVNNYVEGDGPDGVQKRPATISAPDYAYEVPSELVENVFLQVKLDPAVASFPFAGSMTTDVGSGPSTLVVSVVASGLLVGHLLQVEVGTTYYRGGVQVVTVTNIVGTAISVTPPLADAALPLGRGVYPCPQNHQAIRDAAIQHFDTLGPGDTTTPRRWPAQSARGRAVLYRQALAGAVIAPRVPGVLSATVVLPTTDITPAAKEVVRLGALVLEPEP